MKHPALTRVLAIILAVLSLTMAAAGALGLRQAQKDRRLTAEDMARLRGRIEEYRSVTENLEGTKDYDVLSGLLDERQQAYDKESSEHRSELGMFTATQYGLGAGLEGIDEAEALFAAYKAQFEQGLAAFQNGLAQVNTLLANLWTLYNAAVPILTGADTHLSSARGISATLDSGEDLSYAQVAAAYDELLSIADDSAAAIETLRGLEPTLDALAAFDISSLTAMADGMKDVPSSFGGFGDISLDAYLEQGVTVDVDLSQITALKESYDQVWAGVKQALALYDTASTEAETRLQELTGMSSAELRAQAQSTRDELALHGDEPLDPALNAAVRSAWTGMRDSIMDVLDKAESGLQELNGYLSQIHSFLSTLQLQIDALNALLAKAGEMIAAAQEALYQARALIWQQMGLQREKEEELWQRKDELDQEALTLQELSDEAGSQKELEQRQSTLRTNLLSRDGIRARMDAGEELGAAAESFLEETLGTAEDTFARRRIACLLMLFGAGYCLIGIPAAFEAAKSRLLLILPLLHCLGCAVGAEQILWKLGRGLSYSCLVVAIFALLQLLVSRPLKKKKKKHLKRRTA